MELLGGGCLPAGAFHPDLQLQWARAVQVWATRLGDEILEDDSSVLGRALARKLAGTAWWLGANCYRIRTLGQATEWSSDACYGGEMLAEGETIWVLLRAPERRERNFLKFSMALSLEQL